MGGAQSVEKAQKQIGEIHSNIDQLVSLIQKEGNDIVKYITDMDYTQQDALCRKLEYQYVDILKKNFPIRELKGIALAQTSGVRRVQLGMMLPKAETTDKLLDEKTQICQSIVRLFKRKVEVIQNLQQSVPECRDKEREIHNNLSLKMQKEPNISTEIWEKNYQIMTKFNKDIKTKYTKIRSLIGKVLNADNERQLDSLHKEATELINETRKICDLTINRELRDLRTGDINQPAEKPVNQPAGKPAEKPVIQPGMNQPGMNQPEKPVNQPVQGKKPPPIISVNEQLRQEALRQNKLIVLYDFSAEGEKELNVKKNDLLTLIDPTVGEGWYLVEDSKGNKGFVPVAYLFQPTK